uniref:Uncharacterized protein n=2 Tax=Canis lupus TaxID=9612 RepID=A0A8C0T5M8_CANLF
MRHSYNKLYLPTPNRPKIPNCVLLSQPYSTCHHSSPHPNTMKLYRSNSSNNCPWPNVIHTILLRQLKLRMNP